jgi:phage gp46-like protein
VRGDLGETELGSLLWLLERAPLTPDIERWARQLGLEALAPLKSQGIQGSVVVRIDCKAVAVPEQGRLELSVDLFGRDGAKVYERRFDLIWQQLQGS